ncbi:hypothetical protein AA313_de0204159 [Arthrobotrys entomopaga]|nr:hypothetical protein AA313_de0204159 [Arthrobotrys entomopaga]
MPGTPQPGATGQRPPAGAEASRPNSAIASRPLGTPMSRTSSRNVPHPPVSPNSQDKAAAALPSTTSTTSATPMSRTTSTSTARAPPTQASQSFPATPTLGTLEAFPPQPRRTPKAASGNVTATSPTSFRRSHSPSSSSSSSSSSRSSDESSSADNEGLYKRRNFRKFGSASRIARPSKEETEEEETPAFLLWNEGAGDGTNSTAAEGVQNTTPGPPKSKQRRPRPPATGGYEPDRGQNTSGGTIKRGLQQINIQPYNPISDSGASTPASQSSPRRQMATKTNGVQSSPSMGSSFSDLSDASVTQSALEDQFLSAVGAGGSIVSRMSSISQAFRGRPQL